MAHFAAKLGLPLLAVLSVGCTTIGAEFGSTADDAVPINSNGEYSYAVPGAIPAPLSDDDHYRGQLFQITKDSTFNGAGPRWSVRLPGWSDEDRWSAAATQSAIIQGPTVEGSECAE
jgi:hypothetical protein